jgi:hypothetical protein
MWEELKQLVRSFLSKNGRKELRAEIQREGGLIKVCRDGYSLMSGKERQLLYALCTVSFVGVFGLLLWIAK